MRWVKGQNGNPKGPLPRVRYLSEALHATLQRTVDVRVNYGGLAQA